LMVRRFVFSILVFLSLAPLCGVRGPNLATAHKGSPSRPRRSRARRVVEPLRGEALWRKDQITDSRLRSEEAIQHQSHSESKQEDEPTKESRPHHRSQQKPKPHLGTSFRNLRQLRSRQAGSFPPVDDTSACRIISVSSCRASVAVSSLPR
jgi:hypothetical protein